MYDIIRDAKVQRFDAKIISPLSQYATICKHARDDVKNTFTARDKELTRKRHLDRLRERNPRNRQMIVSLFHSLTQLNDYIYERTKKNITILHS